MFFTPAVEPDDTEAEWLSAAEIFDIIKQSAGASMKVTSMVGFGRKLSNMEGLKRRRFQTVARYLVKRLKH